MFKDKAAAQRWITSGTIAELQEGLSRLEVGFSAFSQAVSERKTRRENKYDVADVAKEFNAGLLAALKLEPIEPDSQKHWAVGYSAGCEMRRIRHDKLNAYLTEIGCETMAIIKLA